MRSPIRSVKNQYLGINAHLCSLLQTEGGWDSFHTLHIGHLATALQAQLRPLGYVAVIEPSLQIRRTLEPIHHPKSDVMIYDALERRGDASTLNPRGDAARS